MHHSSEHVRNAATDPLTSASKTGAPALTIGSTTTHMKVNAVQVHFRAYSITSWCEVRSETHPGKYVKDARSRRWKVEFSVRPQRCQGHLYEYHELQIRDDGRCSNRSRRHFMCRGPGRAANLCERPNGHSGRRTSSRRSSPQAMGCDRARAVEKRGPQHSQGWVVHVERTSYGTRPGPHPPSCQVIGSSPARQKTVLKHTRRNPFQTRRP